LAGRVAVLAGKLTVFVTQSQLVQSIGGATRRGRLDEM